MSASEWRVGIDLGGSKIEGILMDREGQIHRRQRVATPAGDYPGTLAAVAGLVQQLEQGLAATAAVGLGTPGSERPDGLIKNANSTCLNGQALRRDLESLLARKIRLANDADCLALSEAVDGAGAGARTVFAVILGTGVGAGIVINGSLLSGPNGIAGEWGHNPMPSPTATDLPLPNCYCGRQGCIETYLSGPGMLARARREGSKADSPAELFAQAGHRPAPDHPVAGYCERLARALAVVINILDPEVIVLAGGLSRQACLYQQIPARWGAYVFADEVRTRLLAAHHGDASGVRGAAWLWPGTAECDAVHSSPV